MIGVSGLRMPDLFSVKTLPYGPLGSNMYLLEFDDRFALIDPSAAPSYMDLSFIHDTEAVFVTHGHFDHIFFIQKWQDILGKDVPFYISDKDKGCLDDDELNVSELFMSDGRNFKADTVSCDGINGKLIFNNKVKVTVIDTPGHSRGSVCYLFEAVETGEKVMFSGDMLFKGSIGRYDMPGSDFNEMLESVKKLSALSGDITVYPGHGPSTSLLDEKRMNPYFS